ncbi:MAG: 4-hydroxy-tetrahydrodipicolinate reductase [Actinomycetota bacterium]|jgi:4-hydroxy-tetrahydrodipicolinate reductase|nr:4-hydroxy-tetrahydrodipicolinate reductase [Actinomycetota bacterium]MDQ1383010.1 4-hydroxy-tetrahydrodipicolinate reductase [Actinomycetota bacterium]
MIRVGVFGAGGRMGSTVCRAVGEAPDMELVAAVDPVYAGAASAEIPLAAEAHQLEVAGAQVAVDFTVLAAARENLRWCAAHGVHAVVGTTGFGEDELAELAELFAQSKANAVIVPNFAVGAVLMMRFAEMAAPFFETAEIMELHHDRKVDAPSGTAALTARRMSAASKDWADDPTTTVVAEGARGALIDGIPVHSLRIRGMVAHQEVLLGTTGQTLSIRHDSYDRASFMPGVLLAVRKIAETPGLTIGLDSLLGL